MAQKRPVSATSLQDNIQSGAGQASKSVLTQISQKKGDEQSKAKLKIYIIKRIQSEIVIGHKIKHPNIVDFVYFSETGNNIYIFM